MIIEKKYHFYAAHRNKKADEKCGRIHGHTYYLTAKFEFDKQDDSGICLLFSRFDDAISPIIKKHDHHFFLAEDDPLVPILKDAGEPFVSFPFETSLENLAKYFWGEIRATSLPIVELTLQETTTSKVIYDGK